MPHTKTTLTKNYPRHVYTFDVEGRDAVVVRDVEVTRQEALDANVPGDLAGAATVTRARYVAVQKAGGEFFTPK